MRHLVKNFVGFHMKKTKVVLDNLIYIRFCVLDLAKLEMQQFHYDDIKQQDWQANLLYTNIDSLIYEIFHQHIYEWMKSHLHYFDTSDYPYQMLRVNKKVTLKIKSEDMWVNHLWIYRSQSQTIYLFKLKRIYTQKGKRCFELRLATRNFIPWFLRSSKWWLR